MKSIKSFKYAWKGLITTWREEHNFRFEILATTVVVISIFYFHFSFEESLACVLMIAMVLSAEIANTAIEDLCNKVESGQDPVIGKIKDTMGAYVFVCFLGALVIGFMVFYHHFM